MNSLQPVRIGVIGLGNFGILHAETVHQLAECQLAAIIDSDQERLRLARQEFREVPAFADFQHAKDQVDIDGWIVAASTNSHVALAKEILTTPAHLLIEKPLAGSLAQAESIADLVRPNPSRVMLGHIALFGSEFQELIRQSRGRKPLKLIDAVRHRPTSTLKAYPNESPFHLTMVHDLYCVQVLMDGCEPNQYSAQVRRNTDGEIDLALAQLTWRSGTIASLTASFLTPPGMPSDGFDRMEVFGSDWAVRIETNPRPIQLWDETSRFPVTLEISHQQNSVAGMLAEELRCFCRVIRNLEQVPIGASYDDAIQVMRWLDKISEIAFSAPS